MELISGKVKVNSKNSITVAAYYRPPNRTDEAYLSKTNDEIALLRDKNKRNIFLLGGDFNIPDINWATLQVEGSQYPNRVNQSFLDMTVVNSLEQIVTFPTRKDKTLDLIFTSHPSFMERCKPMPSIGNSDHDIVLLDTSLISRPPKPVKRKIYLWKQADVQGIQDDLAMFGSTFCEDSQASVEDMWSSFKGRIHTIIDERVPSKMTQARQTHPWMNRSIRRTIRRKQRAHKRSRRTGTKKDKDRYKKLQAEVQFEVRSAHKQYMQDVVSDSYKGNSKKFWSYIKSTGQESAGVSPLKNEDGFLKSDNQSKANILNNQFESVFTKEDTSSIPDKGPSPHPEMPNIEVNWKGVHKLLKGLKSFKATGPDSIPAFILKAAADQLAPILTQLYQTSLNTGQIPTDWREAWIVPVFKKGDRHKAANYRPVSLTSITCKLLEHIIHSNVMAHFDRFSILKDNQHGFRKRRSCETQLIVTIQEIASKLSKGQQVDVILLDFAKAFDKVPHSRLLYKLDYYGVRGQTNTWIKGFLSDRKQQVLLEGTHSIPADVLSGVPQGTVLGPLLFLAYINDLPDSLRSSDARLFADDSLLYRTVNGAKDNSLLQEDLAALEEWERIWQMSFNPSKCSVIRVTAGKRKKVFQSSYRLHGQELEVVDSSKYLGVKVTNDLTWSSHIADVAGKANRSLGFLRRNFKQCTKDVKAATYTTMVRPVLDYPSTVWDPHKQGDIKTLEQVQRRAARYVCNDYTSRTPGCISAMVEDIGWESLQERRYTARVSLLYKIQHGLVDIESSRYMRPSDSRTRGQRGLFQERTNCDAHFNSFFPCTIRDWNELPRHITEASTLEEFRISLARQLVHA